MAKTGALKRTVEKVGNLKRLTIKAGILEGATYPGTGKSVAEIAKIQEFGAPGAGIPARPFMWKAWQDNNAEWRRLLGVSVREYLNQGHTLEDIKTVVGTKMVEGIRDAIRSDMQPANKPSTIRKKIKRRGEDPGTLRDTFTMLNAVDYE